MRKDIVVWGLCLLFACSCTENDKKAEQSETSGISSTATVSTNTKEGSQLFNTCVACHGQNAEGNQSLGAPSLVNQDDWYLIRQLENFKSGIRGADPSDVQGTQMATMAKLLDSPDKVKAVVSHIKSLAPSSTTKTIEGDPKAGKQYYSMICGACHSEGAIGNEALNAPKLVGTDDWYLHKQYKNFADGIRGSHPEDTFGSQMQMMSTSLPDEEALLNVIAYIKSLEQ
ncbi:MAG: c-type cytochrome [Reichenbachiella sp.]|uniref:cytochrome c4 n=2 Tax=Reichenbachiella sp. TaxID=2184521 RepID=UPI003298143B